MSNIISLSYIPRKYHTKISVFNFSYDKILVQNIPSSLKPIKVPSLVGIWVPKNTKR